MDAESAVEAFFRALHAHTSVIAARIPNREMHIVPPTSISVRRARAARVREIVNVFTSFACCNTPTVNDAPIVFTPVLPYYCPRLFLEST